MPQRRRKFASLFISPKSLALISLPLLFLVTISIAIVFAIHLTVLRALEQVEIFGLENLPAMNTLHQAQHSVTLIGTLGIAILAVGCFVWWIIFSHRIYGPIIPIRRHIQSLVDGNYSSHISMRAGDHLKEVVDDLNRLAEVLENKSKAKK